MEQRLQQMLGEQAFSIAALATQIEQLQAENAKLKESAREKEQKAE